MEVAGFSALLSLMAGCAGSSLSLEPKWLRILMMIIVTPSKAKQSKAKQSKAKQKQSKQGKQEP